jgi:hypothetical protein
MQTSQDGEIHSNADNRQYPCFNGNRQCRRQSLQNSTITGSHTYVSAVMTINGQSPQTTSRQVVEMSKVANPAA